MQRIPCSENARAIADIASIVIGGIAIEDLFVAGEFRHTNVIIIANNGRKITADDQKITRIARSTKIANGAVLIIVAINPFEALRIKIHLMERRFATVYSIQISDARLQSFMAIPM